MKQVLKSFCLLNRLTQESPDNNFKDVKKYICKLLFYLSINLKAAFNLLGNISKKKQIRILPVKNISCSMHAYPTSRNNP